MQSRLLQLVFVAILAVCHLVTIAWGVDHCRPVAMERLHDGRICVLCRDNGSICFIDPTTNAASTNSVHPAAQLSDLAVVDATHTVVLDATNHELLSVRINGDDTKVIGRVTVPHSPVNVVVHDRQAFVSSLWSRQWSVVRLDDVTKPSLERTVDLPFSPRHQILLDESEVIVFDSFGGQWARIDAQTGSVIHTSRFTGTHNITGVAFDSNRGNLLIPHMTLNAEKPTTKFNVHWGDIVLNVVRQIPTSQIRKSDEITDDLYYLGRPDVAAGDPTGILITQDDRQIVCFSGTSEVGVSDRGANTFTRVAVGCRPVAMELNADHSRFYVANHLDESISVIDINRKKLISTIELRSQTTAKRTPAQMGERLFFDSTLSSDGWFSCHSCHTDGHTNGGLADTFGDGSTGDAKRIPSLLGAGATGPWSWTGDVQTLQDQIHKSIRTTMRGPPLTNDQILSLAAYVRTLQPAPSVNAARGKLDGDRMARGRSVFNSFGCADCHADEHYTSANTYAVGFHDESGNEEFNPPSLRAVSQRHRLLHDNRAASVHEVIDELRHQNDGSLSESDLRDLIYFVEGL